MSSGSLYGVSPVKIPFKCWGWSNPLYRGGPIFRPLLPTSSSTKVTSDQGREGRVRAELARVRDQEDLVHWGREERRQGVKH